MNKLTLFFTIFLLSFSINYLRAMDDVDYEPKNITKSATLTNQTGHFLWLRMLESNQISTRLVSIKEGLDVNTPRTITKTYDFAEDQSVSILVSHNQIITGETCVIPLTPQRKNYVINSSFG